MTEYTEYQIQRETLVGIADQARRLGNVTEELSPEQIKWVLSKVPLGQSSISKYALSCLPLSVPPIVCEILEEE